MRGGHRREKKKKAKEWYVIVAPKVFGEIEVGETLADDPAKLLGRTVELTLDELTGHMIRSSHTKLLLQISPKLHEHLPELRKHLRLYSV